MPAGSSTESRQTGPVGQGDYVVEQGDCLESIAVRSGHFWQTIWNAPENRDLKAARRSPNILLPGDRLVIPEIRTKEVPGATDQRHRFRRKGVPSRLQLRVLIAERPRANEPFRLLIDGVLIEGSTDADGCIDLPIPPDAQRGELVVGQTLEDRQTFQLNFGHMDPVSEITGIQKRLLNLGYLCEPTGELDDQTRQAITAFQHASEIEETGEPDSATRDKLVEEHGS